MQIFLNKLESKNWASARSAKLERDMTCLANFVGIFTPGMQVLRNEHLNRKLFVELCHNNKEANLTLENGVKCVGSISKK